MTALAVLEVLIESKKNLTELEKLVRVSPQILVNIHVRDKSKFSVDPEIQKVILEEEKKLNGRGRILVRPSGTEPLVRVMAEGPDFSELEQVVKRVAAMVENRLK